MDEHGFLERSVELASKFRENLGYTPFGALVVRDGEILGEGISSVILQRDPTAHAEVLAVRESCQRVGSHLLTGAVVYCSGYPCPLCLMTCYWADVSRVVTLVDIDVTRAAGFDDLAYYEQLRLAPGDRSVQVDVRGGELQDLAVDRLWEWRQRFDSH